MKNKILMILAILAMAVSLAACGENVNQAEPIATQETEIADIVPKEEVAVTVVTESTEEVVREETVEEIAVKEESVQEETEVIVEEPSEEMKSESEEGPIYSFAELDAIKYAKSSVNVRNLPDITGDKLGGLSQNDEIHITGQCNETGWFRIEYNGQAAYVSNDYMVDDKVVISVESEPAKEANNTTAGHWYDNYQKYVWYDMGDYVFCIVGSVEEARSYTFCSEANSYAELLRQRYPDRNATYGGNGPQDQHVALISAVGTNELGHPKWDDVHYVWQ